MREPGACKVDFLANAGELDAPARQSCHEGVVVAGGIFVQADAQQVVHGDVGGVDAPLGGHRSLIVLGDLNGSAGGVVAVGVAEQRDGATQLCVPALLAGDASALGNRGGQTGA